MYSGTWKHVSFLVLDMLASSDILEAWILDFYYIHKFIGSKQNQLHWLTSFLAWISLGTLTMYNVQQLNGQWLKEKKKNSSSLKIQKLKKKKL